MKISYNWLKQYIDTDLSPEKMGEILTDTGLEVEGIEKVESIQGGLAGVVIGEVLTKEKHPDADKLNITTVNLGNETVQIVCGAPNVDAGQKVPVATVGCTLYPSPDEAFKIKKSKIRGVESFGMICAEDELGLGKSHDGIMVLDSSAKPGTPASEYFQLETDFVIEIGLTPNRADAMGHIGVARDLKAYLNAMEGKEITLNLPYPEALPEGNSLSMDIAVDNLEACPRYAGVCIDKIEVKESPEWLQNRLKAIGLKPINNVVDATNFVLHETGNPLHAFDFSHTKGSLSIKTLPSGTEFTTLDEVERKLDENDLMICHNDTPLCIAGVMGGLESGVKDSTTQIFLECAYFNPVSVRKTAKRHAINSDSSFRFERGVDPNNVINTLNRCASLICEIANGEIASEVIDLYPNPIQNFTVDFSYSRCNTLIGQEIPKETVDKILSELDILITEKNGDQLTLSVPPYRTDVQREADVIEEVLRIYGFNKIEVPTKINASINKWPSIDPEKIQNMVADYLVGLGFSEMMNNSLTSSKYLEKYPNKKLSSDHNVVILNPLSSELDVMRQSLVFNGLESIIHNQNRQSVNLKLYEFGKTYHKYPDGYQENKMLSIFLTGQRQEERWNSSKEEVSFFTLKGIIESLINRLGLNKNIQVSGLKDDFFTDGINISIMKKQFAQIGWIDQKLTNGFDIKNKVYSAVINWDNLLELLKINKVKFKEISKTQAVRRDLSLLIDKQVNFAQIEEIAFKCDRKLLKKVDLFDVYEGKNLPENKKSYAVSFTLHDEKSTLQDKQIEKVMSKIQSSLESQLEASLR